MKSVARRSVKLRLLASAAVAALIVLTPVVESSLSPAQAQTRVSVSVEFRKALEPHGRFHRHSRWGEVWVPAKVSRDWRPYTLGRWAYTDDWGWYWASDEEDFGWIVYHYGRWVFDEELGWCWVAGDRWAPAWVSWRRGPQYVGWAPLPPDEVVVEYVERPDYWFFVRTADLLAPRVSVVLIPRPRYTTFFQQTVIVNRTVIIRDDRARFAVNPGIEPTYVAAAIGRPIRAYDVRPRVLAGVSPAFEQAITVRAGERVRERVVLRETREVIRPAAQVEPPRRLERLEEGRLGERPPRAARQFTRDEERKDADRTTGERPGEQRAIDRQPRQDDAREQRRELRDGQQEGAQEQRRDKAGEQRQEQREQTRDRVQDRRDQSRDQGQAREQQQRQREEAQEKLQRERETRGEQAREKQEQAREQQQRQREEAREKLQRERETRGEQAREKQEQARERQQLQQQREQVRERAQEQRQQLREQRDPARERGQERRDSVREQLRERDRGATTGRGDVAPRLERQRGDDDRGRPAIGRGADRPDPGERVRGPERSVGPDRGAIERAAPRPEPRGGGDGPPAAARGGPPERGTTGLGGGGPAPQRAAPPQAAPEQPQAAPQGRGGGGGGGRGGPPGGDGPGERRGQ